LALFTKSYDYFSYFSVKNTEKVDFRLIKILFGSLLVLFNLFQIIKNLINNFLFLLKTHHTDLNFNLKTNFKDLIFQKNNPMLCLSCFLPGKFGKAIKKFSIILGAAIILYSITWAMVLREFGIEPVDASLVNDKLRLVFKAENMSIFQISIIDLNLYDSDDEILDRASDDLPLLIPPYSVRYLTIFFENVEFESVEIILKTMLIKKSFKKKLNKTET